MYKHKDQLFLFLVLNTLCREDKRIIILVWRCTDSSIVSIMYQCTTDQVRGHRGRDRMVFGFTTTYAISAYHHWCCEFVSTPGTTVSPTNKTDRHDISEILLKVALSTIKQTKLKKIKSKMKHLYKTNLYLEQTTCLSDILHNIES
jgi:hypothetical protein